MALQLVLLRGRSHAGICYLDGLNGPHFTALRKNQKTWGWGYRVTHSNDAIAILDANRQNDTIRLALDTVGTLRTVPQAKQ